MKLAIDVGALAVLLFVCWRGYQQRRFWLCTMTALLLHIGRERVFCFRFVIYSPIFVGWLLLCHWMDVKGWHATAAGLMALSMTIALEAMRQSEERRKQRFVFENREISAKMGQDSD
ncbi:MAG: hypothetical protein R8K53_05055 [Mariprofundaceae bacterium]